MSLIYRYTYIDARGIKRKSKPYNTKEEAEMALALAKERTEMAKILTRGMFPPSG